MRTLLALFLLALAFAAGAQEQAFTNRSTDLKERGADDGKTVATLPEGTSVKVLARSGGWTRVEANGKPGYVRVFHLRFPAAVETSSSGGAFSGLSNFIGGNRKPTQATIATTGIRGLSPEDLKNASPDAAALAKAQGYRAEKPAAERFAREGKLAAVNVEYPQGGRR
jgi:hypothetical protein